MKKARRQGAEDNTTRNGFARFTVSLDKKLSADLERYRKAMARREGHYSRSKVVQQALRQFLRMQSAEVRF